jgi:hypothetical protein
MRTILITGPGGSGRTTVAAATALAAAREGTRTLVLGSDRADTLGTALGAATGPVPQLVAPNLTAWRPDAAEHFRDDLTAFQSRATAALDLLGASRLDPEEVTPLPGAEELSLLRALRDAALAEAHDLVVVDLPPTPQALALLALPEELRRSGGSRRPVPCAPFSAGWPACPCPRSGCTRPPPAGTSNSPPPRPSSPTATPSYGWSPSPARPAPTPSATPGSPSPCAACAPTSW